MGSWWVQDALAPPHGGYIFLFSWVFWVILSICLHELGHGFAAIDQGDDTPIVLGHMNLNPLVHMGQFSLIMFALVGIAWGAMPVNPSRFRQGRLGDAKVAAAGPAVNLLLALVTLTGLGVLSAKTGSTPPSDFVANLRTFLWVGGLLNLVLLGLNLLPIPPLDGSRIVAAFSYSAMELYHREGFDRFSLLILLAVFWFGGPYLWSGAAYVATTWTDLIVQILT